MLFLRTLYKIFLVTFIQIYQNIEPPSYQTPDLRVAGYATLSSADYFVYRTATVIGREVDPNVFFTPNGGRWKSTGSSVIVQFRSNERDGNAGFRLIVSLV